MYHLKIAIRDADTWRDPGLAEVCEKNLGHLGARTVTVVGGLVAALGTFRISFHHSGLSINVGDVVDVPRLVCPFNTCQTQITMGRSGTPKHIHPARHGVWGSAGSEQIWYG